MLARRLRALARNLPEPRVAASLRALRRLLEAQEGLATRVALAAWTDAYVGGRRERAFEVLRSELAELRVSNQASRRRALRRRLVGRRRSGRVGAGDRLARTAGW